MAANSVFAEELMKFALSKAYQHPVIFTNNACWTTIGMDEPITGRRLLEICEVHLIYIGIHMFAKLKQKPFIPITATALLELPTVEIPSLDDRDTVLSAIDLTFKQKEQTDDTQMTIDTQNSTEDSSDNDVPDNRYTSQPNTSTNQPNFAVPPVSNEVSSMENHSDSGSMSDSLLSPKQSNLQPNLDTNINTSSSSNNILGTYNDQSTSPLTSCVEPLHSVMGSNNHMSPSQGSAPGTNTGNNQTSDEHALTINSLHDVSMAATQGTTEIDDDQPMQLVNEHPAHNTGPSPDSDCTLNKGLQVKTTPNQQIIRDKYTDAPLSGAFECLHDKDLDINSISLNMYSLEAVTKKESAELTPIDTFLLDHTYCVNWHQFMTTKSVDDSIIGKNIVNDSPIINPVNQQVINEVANLTLENTDNSEAIEISMVLDSTVETMQ